MLLTCFIAYLLLLIILAKLLSKRMAGLSDFFLAGQSLPAISIAIAFVAAWFGAGSTIGSMNKAFDTGLSALWLIAIPSVLSCLAVGLFLAKQVRNINCISMPEAIEKQYGAIGSFLLAWIILASLTTFIASQLVAAGHLLEITIGLSPVVSISIILGAVILYSVIGGYRAVVMTDVMQFLCYTTGILILVAFVLWFPQNGNTFTHLPTNFWNPWIHLKSNLAMVFTFVLAWSIAPEMWQRMSSSRSAAEAQKAAVIAGSILACLYTFVMIIGLRSVYYLPAHDPFAHKNVLIALALRLPSPVLTAIVLVGVLSAISSTTDSSLNVATLTFTRDIVNRYLWPRASHQQLVRLSQVTTVFIAIPASILALYYQSIIQILWISADIYASTMFIPIIGLFYIRGAGRWAGILSMCFGAIPVILNFFKDFHLMTLPQWWPVWPFTTLLGIGLSLIGFGIGYYFSRASQESTIEEPVLLETI